MRIDWPTEFIYFYRMKNNIKNIQTKILADDWAVLKKLTYEYQRNDGTWETHIRQAYDRGNGVAILLYSPEKKTVILTRQFRIPTYLNGNASGMLIETCAGKLDVTNPEECIRREAEEETGIKLNRVTKIFEAYMSPGSVTELIHFYVASYNDDMKTGPGGGAPGEQENIEVIEIPFTEALAMIDRNEIRDGKTIMLLQHAALKRIL